MKYRYTRYTGDELEGIDLEELVSKLSDMLLSSGFDDDPRAPDPDQKMSRQDPRGAVVGRPAVAGDDREAARRSGRRRRDVEDRAADR
jgi:hypothetical protein